jgi:hypothetical protein
MERLDLLYGIGVDDLVPYPVLALLSGHVPYVLIDDHELREGRDVEAGAHPIESPDYLRQRVCFDGVIGLDAGESFRKLPVIIPYPVMVKYEDRRAMPLRDSFQTFEPLCKALCHFAIISPVIV